MPPSGSPPYRMAPRVWRRRAVTTPQCSRAGRGGTGRSLVPTVNLRTRIAARLAASVWVTVLGSIASIISFGLVIASWARTGSPVHREVIVFVVISGAFLLLALYSVSVREEALALKAVADDFRDISRILRDTLRTCFAEGATRQRLVRTEKETLHAICQRIARLYARLIRRECMVTVKVLTRDNGRLFASTLARSEIECDRDSAEPVKFVVNEGKNTGFDQAIMTDHSGGTPHFFSADLKRHRYYRNERQDFLRHYQSVLVVPIHSEPLGTAENALGFLAVDTKSRNRLNNGHHLVMLASLSDQLANFMNLMRGGLTTHDADGRDDSTTVV